MPAPLYNLRVLTVEIIVVGNEILLGVTQDTNSNYLCRMIRGMGGRVRHISVVRDERESIVEEINASLARRPNAIFTCGGLGPADDDLTVEAVASAMGLRLEVAAEARELIEARYRELASRGYVPSPQMNEARLKMAEIPEGARVLGNPVGVAPCIVVEEKGCRVISLPGAPSELKGIVEGPLQELLRGMFGRGSYREREVLVDCGDESLLAPALRRVASAHPEVYIKSRASGLERDLKFRILISASATSSEEAEAMLERARQALARELRDI
ncbi:MAG TPA: molybdopterin-binding protein [Blastocatellia bacterium]|nr:molybdopterin-binding protein [Blastocatellia bacterium]